MRLILVAAAVLIIASASQNIVTDGNREVSDTFIAEEVVNGINTFGVDMLQTLSGTKEKENIFLSPYSVGSALAMTLLGSRGNTEKELIQTFHFQHVTDSDLHLSLRNMIAALNLENSAYTMESANRLFVQTGYHILEEFTEDCEFYYGASEGRVNFEESESAAQIINEWIKEKTHDKIRDLIKPGVLSALTRVVLANAVYFKGSWMTQFKKDMTTVEKFYVTSDDPIDVEMMYQKGKFQFASVPELKSDVLELPYQGNDIKMVVVLPNEDADIIDVAKGLDFKLIKNNIETTEKETVIMRMPKFKLTNDVDLSTLLSQLGVNDLFDANKSDLSGINGFKDLFVSAAVHKAYISVDEEGSEAAAASAVVMNTRMMVFTEEFVMNRPFLFYIYDSRSDVVLFLGRMTRPSIKNGRDEL